MLRHLKSLFIENGDAYSKQQLGEQLTLDLVGDGNSSGIEIPDGDLLHQVKQIISSSDSALMTFEKWEFIKDYKYSILFIVDGFMSFYDLILEKNNVIKSSEEQNESAVFAEGGSSPIIFEDESHLFLKYSLGISAFKPETLEEVFLKYPVVIVLHKDYQVVELRFEGVKSYFKKGKNGSTYYSELIDKFLGVIYTDYSIILKPIELDFIIGKVKGDDNVKLTAQYMQMTSGGNAQLEVGINEEYVLPFIDEIKSLMVDHKIELEKVPNLKEALEQFIYEKEEMSNYPWIQLLWNSDVKIRSIQAKLIFNYQDKKYCLIQHYYSNSLVGMERMNHVTKYICDNRPHCKTEY